MNTLLYSTQFKHQRLENHKELFKDMFKAGHLIKPYQMNIGLISPSTGTYCIGFLHDLYFHNLTSSVNLLYTVYH